MTETTLVIVPLAATPWYQLAVVRRLSLGIVLHLIAASKLASYFGWMDAATVNEALNYIGLAIDSWALHGRVTKPCPPVAASKAAADKANSTQGVTS
jgi:hypothetical protein